MDYNHSINAVVSGYMITIIAILLNAMSFYVTKSDWSAYGVLLGCLVIGIAYIQENMVVLNVHSEISSVIAILLSTVCLSFSYSIWFCVQI